MSWQFNDNIVASMLLAGDDTTSIAMEAVSWPESPITGSLSLDDRLSKAFTPEGKLRVIMT